jgi:hypothetical protein
MGRKPLFVTRGTFIMTQSSAAALSQQASFDTSTSKQSPHYRMTPEMAQWEFQQGMSTVKGYLYHLIKASRKDGHRFRIKNVRAFCKEQDFSPSAYYKAIAELKADGLIEFEVHGSMDLWIPEKVILFGEKKSVQNNGHLSTKVDTQSKIMDTPSTKVDTRSSNALNEGDLADPSDLLQLSLNSFKRERKQNNQNLEIEDPKKKALSTSSDTVQSSISSRTIATNSEWEKFSAPGRDPEFFDFVVRRTQQFPQPPADARCAAEVWIRKQGHILYPEYLQWQDSQQRAAERMQEAIPVETVPVPMVESEPMTAQKWLERYQGMWEADERSRQYIRKAIAQHPERGVCLGENGPELVAEEGRSLQGVDLSEGRSPELETFSGIAEDFSDVLAGIDVEIRRLGWDAHQMSDHLRQSYGKNSRQQLTDQELLNWLFCLQDKERLTG